MAMIGCEEFETLMDGYRDGTLPAALAAEARAHVAACPACAEAVASANEAMAMLAALPDLEPPERLLRAIYDRTTQPRISRTWPGNFADLWRTITSPRFALGLAMAVFAFSLILNAAQINLRRVSIQQLTPDRVAGNIVRSVNRSWGHAVAYYHDLRVVYEIQAALHQMRQEPPAPAPAGHTQRVPPAAGAQALAVLAPIAIPLIPMPELTRRVA